jgi:hypothetical protein
MTKNRVFWTTALVTTAALTISDCVRYLMQHNNRLERGGLVQKLELNEEATLYLDPAPPVTRPENLEDRFVDPNQVVFEVRDDNLNVRYEVVMEYRGQRYLVRYDSATNRVSLAPYIPKSPLLEVR